MSLQIAAPTNVHARWESPGLAEVSWTPSQDNNASAYRINVSSDGGSTWSAIGGYIDGRTSGSAQFALNATGNYLFRVRSVGGGAPSGTAALAAEVVAPPPPPPPPPPPAGVIWMADGSLGGPTNDPWKEWASIIAAGSVYPAHPNINIVQAASIPGVGVVTPPAGHAYMYESQLTSFTGVSPEPYGDRTEPTMETVGEQRYDGSEVKAPEDARWWVAGMHVFLAFWYCVPLVNPESKVCLDPTGNIPLCQFHEPGGGTAHFGLKVRGTMPGGSQGYSYPAPRSTCEWDGADLWQESQNLVEGADAWYRVLLDIQMASAGNLAIYSSRPGEATLTKRGEKSGNTLGSAGKIFPCMGGPRNEGKNVGSEPTAHQRWYYAGWTQAADRESATVAAFGLSL